MVESRDSGALVRPTEVLINGRFPHLFRAQELCESRGGRPGLPSLISLMVSVDVKQHSSNQPQLFNTVFELAMLWTIYSLLLSTLD